MFPPPPEATGIVETLMVSARACMGVKVKSIVAIMHASTADATFRARFCLRLDVTLGTESIVTSRETFLDLVARTGDVTIDSVPVVTSE